MQQAIEAQALTKRFRKLQTYRDLLLYPWQPADHLAVDQVSLRIERGELFGLLGQNGAGKTTLIKMLCTALLPTSGNASVMGYDVVKQARQVRERIGLVNGEERSFYWRLTGRQNLEFFAALYHVPGALAQRRIDDLVRRVGLSEDADRPFRTYSSGMRQKLGIARGLLGAPQVLFMDEPTRSLDPISAQSMRQLVAEYIIGELECTVILATHSMAEAEELCDRALGNHTATLHQRQPVTQLLCLGHRMGCQNNRALQLADDIFRHQPAHRLGRYRIKRARRLIHKEHLRRT